MMNDARPKCWPSTSDNQAGSTQPARSVRALTAGLLGALACSVALLASPGIALAQSGPADGCEKGSEKASFGDRFVSTYKDYLKWDGDPADTPPNWRKGLQPPMVSSPPMPFGNTPMGGTENIGYENIYYGAFMDAIYCGPNGKMWKDTRLTMYGWVAPGMNISTSKSKYNFTSGTGGNWPASYAYAPNTAQLDQVALYFERTPDEVQTDHYDWGFRLANLYGSDYKYTFSKGLGSDQYTQAKARYGYDPVMAYAEFYTPFIAQGTNIRVGRYISIPDIEAQLAPNNYNYSHSLLYSFDPYTQEGIVATTKLNKNWTLQLEASVGNDVAFWYHPKDPATGNRLGTQFTPAVCVNWSSDSGNDVLYPCINGSSRTLIGNKGDWGWNNLQHEVLTWYHKFNDKWHMSTEYWYMYQNNVPNVNNPQGLANYLASPLVAGLNIGAPFGAQCDSSVVQCKAQATAFVNYVVYQPTPRDFISLRNGFFDDKNGQRTGFATRYQEMVLGWNHWIGKAITIRPELRWEKALDVQAYDNPTQCGFLTNGVLPAGGMSNSACSGTGKKSQTMFAIDMIVHF